MTFRSPRHSPSLAAVRLTSTAGLPLLRRVLNANFRLGQAEHAAVLAEAAARSDLPGGARVLALEMLAEWGKPVGARQGDGALAANRAPSATAGRRRPPAQAGRASAFGPRGRPHRGRRSPPRPSASRTRAPTWRRSPPIANCPIKPGAEALKALDQLADPRRIEAAQRALLLPGHRSRTEALRVLAKVDPAAAIQPLRDRLAHGTTAEQQGAIAVLAAMPGDAARRELAHWLDRLIAGQRSRRDPARPDRSRPRTHRDRLSAESSSNTSRPSPRTTRWPRIAKSCPAATPSAG